MEKSIKLNNCAPNPYKLRQVQAETLEFIEKNWDSKKYFCLNLPTGAGKGLIAATIASYVEQNGLGSTAMFTPTKMLQDQYHKDFPYIVALKGADNYKCIYSMGDGSASCSDFKNKISTNKGYCGPECCFTNKRRSAEMAAIAIYNPHIYFYCKEQKKSHLIFDEGHNITPFLESLLSIDLWGCEYDFDDNQPVDYESVMSVLRKANKIANMELNTALASSSGDADKLQELVLHITGIIERLPKMLASNKDSVIFTKKKEIYRKKYWYSKRMNDFADTYQNLITIRPTDVSALFKETLGADTSEKVFFLSATIGKTDMKELGIDSEMTAIYESDSPISPERRKFVTWPVASMTSKNQKESMPKIIEAIEKILEKNKDTKGVIHATYEVANALKSQLNNRRLLFHTKMNKNQIYQEFRRSKGSSVLVASGMSEGIDLPEDLARWQIIAKVQYPSLGDDVWKWKADNRPDSYLWEAIKTIIQQSGRVCRGPDDYGTTYMLDSEFKRVWIRGLEKGFWPEWFKKAIIFVEKK